MKSIANYGVFERISSLMAREFGTIKRGNEEVHAFILSPIEGNLLKMSRKTGNRNGRRAMEAIKIALFTISGYLNDCEYDFSKYLTLENQDFVHAVLMAIDPFTNEVLKQALTDEYDLSSPDGLHEYFSEPIMCLLRIEASAQTWTNRNGVEGYFDFLEEYVAPVISDDYNMDFGARIKNPEKYGITRHTNQNNS
jgi:hypothetical protein